MSKFFESLQLMIVITVHKFYSDHSYQLKFGLIWNYGLVKIHDLVNFSSTPEIFTKSSIYCT